MLFLQQQQQQFLFIKLILIYQLFQQSYTQTNISKGPTGSGNIIQENGDDLTLTCYVGFTECNNLNVLNYEDFVQIYVYLNPLTHKIGVQKRKNGVLKADYPDFALTNNSIFNGYTDTNKNFIDVFACKIDESNFVIEFTYFVSNYPEVQLNVVEIEENSEDLTNLFQQKVNVQAGERAKGCSKVSENSIVFGVQGQDGSDKGFFYRQSLITLGDLQFNFNLSLLVNSQDQNLSTTGSQHFLNIVPLDNSSFFTLVYAYRKEVYYTFVRNTGDGDQNYYPKIQTLVENSDTNQSVLKVSACALSNKKFAIVYSEDNNKVYYTSYTAVDSTDGTVSPTATQEVFLNIANSGSEPQIKCNKEDDLTYITYTDSQNKLLLQTREFDGTVVDAEQIILSTKISQNSGITLSEDSSGQFQLTVTYIEQLANGNYSYRFTQFDSTLEINSTLQCNYKCETCETTPTTCLTCSDETRNRPEDGCPCKDSYYDTQNEEPICQSCEFQCSKCVDSDDNCTECSDSNRSLDNTQKCSCNDGWYYQGSENPVCGKCSDKCATCSAVNTCIICQGLNRPNNPPNCQCLSQYWDDGTDCLQCESKCNECSGSISSCINCQDSNKTIASNCTDCKGDKIIDSSNNCICNVEGQFSLAGQDLCQDCNYKCETCITSADNCITCSDSNRSSDNTIKCSCNEGYFENGIQNKICGKCIYKCQTCIDNDSNCLICKGAFRKSDQPLCTCQDGYYDDGTNFNCQPCQYPCQNCSGVNTCLSCQSDSYRVSSTDCTCNIGYYDNSTECIKCYYKCGKCSDGSSNCVEICSETNRNFNDNCNCKPTFIENDQKICQKCQSPCLECDIQVDNCTSCINDKREGTTCSCKSNYIEDQFNECQQCSYKCSTCETTINQCIICSQPERQNPPTCNCRPGYFEDSTDQNNCNQCNQDNCSECINNADNCTSCIINRQSLPNCDECISGYYKNSSNYCDFCNLFYCKTCENQSTECTECAINREGTPTCPCKSHFYEDSNKYCRECDIKCLECENTSSQCINCSHDTRDPAKNCECQDGLNETGGVECTSCIYKCLTCSGETCTSCAGNRINSNCDCPPDTLDNNTSSYCQQCNFMCLTCQTTIDNCTSCQSGNYRSTDPNNNCSCLPSFYSIDQNLDCVPCDYPCKNCENSAQNCIECYDNINRKDETNNCQCNSHYYENLTEKKCLVCSSFCKECENLSENCTLCYTDAYGRTQDPSLNCKCDLQFYNFQNEKNCKDCVYPCLQCDSDTICISCQGNMTNRLSHPSCYCEPGFYDNINNCELCDEKCKQCDNLTGKCTLCHNNIQVIQNDCECSPTFYFDSVNKTCESCEIPCQTCTSKTDCLSCPSSENRDPITCICLPGFKDNGVKCFDNSTILCSIQCNTCSGTPNNCDTCSDPQNQSLIPDCKCELGYYMSDNSPDCQPCIFPCEKCQPPGNMCLKCFEPSEHRQLINNCVCDDQYFENTSNNNQCEKCDISCNNCQVQKNNCKLCAQGYFIDTNNQNPSITLCISCNLIGVSQCTKSLENDLIQIISCFQGFLKVQDPQNPLQQLCVPICSELYNSNCQTCDHLQCLSCSQQNEYFQICDTNMQNCQIQDNCQKCDIDNCKNCTQNYLECDKCNTGFIFNQQQNKCLKDDSNTQLPNNINSKYCDPTSLDIQIKFCKTCHFLTRQCTSCYKEQYRYISQDGYCKCDIFYKQASNDNEKQCEQDNQLFINDAFMQNNKSFSQGSISAMIVTGFFLNPAFLVHLLDTLQMIKYTIYLQIDFPIIVYQYFDFLAMFELEFIPQIVPENQHIMPSPKDRDTPIFQNLEDPLQAKKYYLYQEKIGFNNLLKEQQENFDKNYKIIIDSKLGKGSFGQVLKVQDKNTKKEYAMKVCYIESQSEEEFFREINNILKLQKNRKSNYVTQIENLIKDEDKKQGTGVNIIMELAECNLLQQYQNSKDPLEPKLVYQMIKNLLQGLKDIFSQNIINRDIKPENILYFGNNVFKYADFGTSKVIDGKSTCTRGSFYYFSPEIYKIFKNDLDVDTKKIDWIMVDTFCTGLSLACAICQIKNLHPCRNEQNGYIDIKEKLQSVKDKKIYDPLVFEIVEKMIINDPFIRKEQAQIEDLLVLTQKLP